MAISFLTMNRGNKVLNRYPRGKLEIESSTPDELIAFFASINANIMQAKTFSSLDDYLNIMKDLKTRAGDLETMALAFFSLIFTEYSCALPTKEIAP
jgi:hypothetical protein